MCERVYVRRERVARRWLWIGCVSLVIFWVDERSFPLCFHPENRSASDSGRAGAVLLGVGLVYRPGVLEVKDVKNIVSRREVGDNVPPVRQPPRHPGAV